VTGWELARGLLVEAAWVVAFAAAARWLYRMGLRRYGAYGG
jgi:ABC-2 type transport system permease protein